MNEILKTTLIGLFFGTFGTTIGGIIGIKFKNTSNKFLSFILAFASGLMIAIGSGFGASLKLGLSLAIAICLHDIPEGKVQSRHQVKNA